jgi:hypothetical protein
MNETRSGQFRKTEHLTPAAPQALKVRCLRLLNSVPIGTKENSPPFQRWESNSREIESPVRDDRTLEKISAFCRP